MVWGLVSPDGQAWPHTFAYLFSFCPFYVHHNCASLKKKRERFSQRNTRHMKTSLTRFHNRHHICQKLLHLPTGWLTSLKLLSHSRALLQWDHDVMFSIWFFSGALGIAYSYYSFNSVSQQKTIRQRTNKGKESWGGMTTGIEPDMN